jgi:thymidylate synthase
MSTHNSATAAWLVILRQLLDHGDIVSPRGLKTRELLGYTSKFNMHYPLVNVAARKLGLRFAAAEAAWILSGDNRVATIAPYSKEVSRFSDDGVWFNGAYGPPLRDQLPYLLAALRKDPDTRQAVATIWRPRPGDSKDVPCTVAVQFLVREGKIHCVLTMRSSDVWLGYTYDIFNLTCLSLYVAAHYSRETGKVLELGTLTLTAGSQHLYERDWESAEACLRAPHETQWPHHEAVTVVPWVANPERLLDHLWRLASTSSEAWRTGDGTNGVNPYHSLWLVPQFQSQYGRE